MSITIGIILEYDSTLIEILPTPIVVDASTIGIILA
jgi:hypothetical protein